MLAYSCIDFGFFQRIFPISETAERIIDRGGGRSGRDASRLPVRLSQSQPLARALQPRTRWLVFLGALVGSPCSIRRSRQGRAHLHRGGRRIGFLVIHLATHGYDRAVMLIPTWVLLIAWVTTAGFTVMGQLTDLVPPA